MAGIAGIITPYCSECGQTLVLVAELPEAGLREHVYIFKCVTCARILIVKEEIVANRIKAIADSATGAIGTRKRP